MRNGQTWTIDFALSILVFLAALGALIYLKTASPANDFNILNRDSGGVMNILLSQGYPESWSKNDMLTPGLLYNNNRLSKRKLIELQKIGYEQYRKTIPYFSQFYITLRRNNTILPIEGRCGFGSSKVIEEKNTTNRSLATALYTRQNSPLEGEINSTLFKGIEIRNLINDINNYEVIILDNPKLSDEKYIDNDAVKTILEESAGKYKTFLLIGDLGTELLGANTSETGSSEGIVVDDISGFKKGMRINFSQAFSIRGDESTYMYSIINNSQDILAAKWVYKDSDIYYFPSLQGAYSEGEDLLPLMINMTRALSSERTAVCANISLPDIENLINIDRIVIYNSSIVRMEAYFWR